MKRILRLDVLIEKLSNTEVISDDVLKKISHTSRETTTPESLLFGQELEDETKRNDGAPSPGNT